MKKLTLRGGNFGGSVVDIDDPKAPVDMLDREQIITLVDAGGQWMYSVDRHAADEGFADFVGMKK
jgi:hypothetical protein